MQLIKCNCNCNDGKRALIFDKLRNSNVDHHDAYILSIYIYKAFDCVDYKFLEKCMKAFGFCDNFCDCICTLLKHSETAVIVNGFISDYFPVKRGVRQGDPLSLHLF